MSKAENSAFIQWLNRELAERGWSDNQLARHAGISHSVISRARGGSPPKWEACEALAQALQLPPELVFRKAGLLPPENDEIAGWEEWKHLLARLPEQDRYELLRIARLKLELREAGNDL
jgi:transcriptional regulator with XRE-family HTH domain